jgi:predicted HTH domain antitoxin
MKTEEQFNLCRAFVQSSSFWHDAPSAPKTEGPVITISQAAGARGNPIAKEIVRQLHGGGAAAGHHHHPWTLFNKSLVRRVVEEHRLPKSTVSFFPEDRTGQLKDMLGQALGLHPGAYATGLKTAETVLRLAQTGHAVIVGRGGNFITRNIARAVHVRLVGSLEVRIASFSKIYHVSHEEAKKEVARRDKARKSYITENFRQDIDDPQVYDVILNTDNLTDSAAARLIVTALEEKILEAT